MKSAVLGLRSRFFSKNPVLIIDRDGLIGGHLSLKLAKEFPVVFVSRKGLDLTPGNQNIICVSFFGRFPIIPDGKYSHIIFIDEQGMGLEFLPKIIDKVKGVNSDFIYAQGLFSKKKYAADKVLKMYPSGRVAIIGDIFSGNPILPRNNIDSTVNKFIYQAGRLKRIRVSGEGFGNTYPVLLEDAVNGLIGLMFGTHKMHSLFYLFPNNPISELSLAHMIQKIHPEIAVDFIKANSQVKKIAYPPNGKNLLGDKYPLAKKIKKINLEEKEEEENGNSSRKSKKIKNFYFKTIWTLIFLLLFPVFFTSFFFFLGLGVFNYAKSEADKGNFINAKKYFHLSRTFFYAGEQTAGILALQAKIASREDVLEKALTNLNFNYQISDNLSQGFNSQTYFSKILSGKSENPTSDFEKGKNYLKASIIALNKLVVEGKISAPILQKLITINPLIKFLSDTIDIMPDALGMNGPRVYLILFQDNMELRPGGGIIDSYGVLKLDMGKITGFSINDINDADNQLRGHVEPPFVVRRYLASKHWYMKDSNFDVDFTKSASASSNFLFVETGQKTDGVISIDTSFIKNILRATGPVYLADYRKSVDENNLHALMLLNTGKEGFLKSLTKTIIAKATSGKTSYFLIAQSISDALAEKHLLFSLNNNQQNIFTVNGWSSSLWDKRANNWGHINDFMGINEANLSFNKINNFIKRQVFQKITIGDEGNISGELTLNYRNESKELRNNDYENYLRIILPGDAKLPEVSIDDEIQKVVAAVTDPLVYEAKNFKEPPGLEIEEINEENKKIFGFLIRIPAGKAVKVKLRYDLPGRILGLNTFSYNLKLFKQPGAEAVPYSFSLAYPKFLNLIESSGNISEEGGRAVFSGEIDQDKNLIVNFAKK